MKLFICLVLITICNVAVNQAAAIDTQEESKLIQFEPSYYQGEIYDVNEEEHSRQRRSSKGQASIDIQKQRGRTSVNAEVGRVWESKNGRNRVEANANYGRDYGRGGSKPNYGGNVRFEHKF